MLVLGAWVAGPGAARGAGDTGLGGVGSSGRLLPSLPLSTARVHFKSWDIAVLSQRCRDTTTEFTNGLCQHQALVAGPGVSPNPQVRSLSGCQLASIECLDLQRGPHKLVKRCYSPANSMETLRQNASNTVTYL